MIKTTLTAGALSLGMVLASPTGPARADADIGISIGQASGYHDPNPYYWPARSGISCRQGVRIVSSAGYRSVRPLDCNGSEYTYQGFRRDRLYKITVRSKNGNIRKAERIRRGGGGWGGGYDDGGYDDGGFGGRYGDDYGDEY